MPRRIRTMDDIMFEEKQDMMFVVFEYIFNHADSDHEIWLNKHLEWYANNNICVETAALPTSSGWISGGPVVHAFHINTLKDEIIIAYGKVFEKEDGESLRPGIYNAWLDTYDNWLKRNPDWQGEHDDDSFIW